MHFDWLMDMADINGIFNIILWLLFKFRCSSGSLNVGIPLYLLFFICRYDLTYSILFREMCINKLIMFLIYIFSTWPDKRSSTFLIKPSHNFYAKYLATGYIKMFFYFAFLLKAYKLYCVLGDELANSTQKYIENVIYLTWLFSFFCINAFFYKFKY